MKLKVDDRIVAEGNVSKRGRVDKIIKGKAYVKWDKELFPKELKDSDKIILEDVFDSPLFKAMNEERKKSI